MKMKPTLDELCRMSKADYQRAVASMTLGELLALAGLKIEVECEGESPEFNAEVSDLMSAYIPDENKQ